MDLEITNSSLLTINSELERLKRSQRDEIIALRRRIRDSLSPHSSIPTHQFNSFTDYSSSSSSSHQEHKEEEEEEEGEGESWETILQQDPAYAILLSKLHHLIKSSQSALRLSPPLAPLPPRASSSSFTKNKTIRSGAGAGGGGGKVLHYSEIFNFGKNIYPLHYYEEEDKGEEAEEGGTEEISLDSITDQLPSSLALSSLSSSTPFPPPNFISNLILPTRLHSSSPIRYHSFKSPSLISLNSFISNSTTTLGPRVDKSRERGDVDDNERGKSFYPSPLLSGGSSSSSNSDASDTSTFFGSTTPVAAPGSGGVRVRAGRGRGRRGRGGGGKGRNSLTGEISFDITP